MDKVHKHNSFNTVGMKLTQLFYCLTQREPHNLITVDVSVHET